MRIELYLWDRRRRCKIRGSEIAGLGKISKTGIWPLQICSLSIIVSMDEPKASNRDTRIQLQKTILSTLSDHRALPTADVASIIDEDEIQSTTNWWLWLMLAKSNTEKPTTKTSGWPGRMPTLHPTSNWFIGQIIPLEHSLELGNLPGSNISRRHGRWAYLTNYQARFSMSSSSTDHHEAFAISDSPKKPCVNIIC